MYPVTFVEHFVVHLRTESEFDEELETLDWNGEDRCPCGEDDRYWLSQTCWTWTKDLDQTNPQPTATSNNPIWYKQPECGLRLFIAQGKMPFGSLRKNSPIYYIYLKTDNLTFDI